MVYANTLTILLHFPNHIIPEKALDGLYLFCKAISCSNYAYIYSWQANCSRIPTVGWTLKHHQMPNIPTFSVNKIYNPFSVLMSDLTSSQVKISRKLLTHYAHYLCCVVSLPQDNTYKGKWMGITLNNLFILHTYCVKSCPQWLHYNTV